MESAAPSGEAIKIVKGLLSVSVCLHQRKKFNLITSLPDTDKVDATVAAGSLHIFNDNNLYRKKNTQNVKRVVMRSL